MTVEQIRTRINAMLQVNWTPSGEADNDPAILARADSAVLQALNSARLLAERRHDFHAAETSVIVTVPASGGGVDLSVAQPLWTPTGPHASATAAVKTITSMWVLTDENLSGAPVRFMDKKLLSKDQQELVRSGRLFGAKSDRYRPDSTALVSGRSVAFLNGLVLFLLPKPETDTKLVLDVNKWFDEYVDGTETDFFTERGYDYLMYQGIVEANLIFQTFVARQEGGISPPTGLADRAWQSLVDYDSYLVEGGRYADLS